MGFVPVWVRYEHYTTHTLFCQEKMPKTPESFPQSASAGIDMCIKIRTYRLTKPCKHAIMTTALHAFDYKQEEHDHGN